MERPAAHTALLRLQELTEWFADASCRIEDVNHGDLMAHAWLHVDGQRYVISVVNPPETNSEF